MATRVKRPVSSPQLRTVIYLYGVTGKPARLSSLTGVDDHASVEPMDCAGLTCWISRVPQLEYADNLAKNMENLDWLSEAGVRHQRVVSAIAAASDTLPARFGTVFMDASSLEADIRKRKKILIQDLRRIHGCEEWGVKVFAVQPKINVPTGKPKTGKDYLQIKAALLRRSGSGDGVGVSGDEFEAFSEALGRISVATEVGGRISGGQRGLQWQSSLLIKRAHKKKIEAILKKYSIRWADSAKIECTGPWPPYSFVSRSS